MNIKGYPAYESNPFFKVGIEEKVVTSGNTREKLVADYETGEHYALRIVNRKSTIVTDKRSFRKIYTDAIDVIKDLPQPGYKMFFFIVKHLESKRDFIDINIYKAMEYCNYKNKTSFYDGIFELIKANCIARSNVKNRYYINTNLFFNGDRTK